MRHQLIEHLFYHSLPNPIVLLKFLCPAPEVSCCWDGLEITELGSPLQEVRSHAAEVIRDKQLYDPTPRKPWDRLLESLPLHMGDTQRQVVEQLNKWGVAVSAVNMPNNSFTVHYRLDDTWVLACAYTEPGLLSDVQISEEPRTISVPPPSNYTGLWHSYRIDGKPTGLLYYSRGEYLGIISPDSPPLEIHHGNTRKTVEPVHN
jgi:hypothetical protein